MGCIDVYRGLCRCVSWAVLVCIVGCVGVYRGFVGVYRRCLSRSCGGGVWGVSHVQVKVKFIFYPQWLHF